MKWIQPMEPVLTPNIVQGDEWIHEIKWDGIRGLTYMENGSVKVFTKRGNERTGFYPELLELSKLTEAKSAVLDGEIVVFDESGNPSFYSSLVRERVRTEERAIRYSELYPAKYIIFDLMHFNGKDLTQTPLTERKKILGSIINKTSSITLTDSFPDGEELYRLVKSKNWEGIVSKQKASPYLPAKNHNLWFKTKLSRKMLAVVGGLLWKDKMPNSLLLGVYKEEALIYIGRASLGLNSEQIYLLKEYSSKLQQKECPFDGGAGNEKNITWLNPAFTCWVHFLEFTNDGHLRHPKILGFSSGKPSEANGREYVE